MCYLQNISKIVIGSFCLLWVTTACGGVEQIIFTNTLDAIRSYATAPDDETRKNHEDHISKLLDENEFLRTNRSYGSHILRETLECLRSNPRNMPMLQTILDHRIDPNLMSTPMVEPAIHTAARLRNLEAMLLLKKFGADVQARDAQRRSLLHAAAIGGCEECLAFAGRKLKTLVNARDLYEHTPLHYAIRSGNEIAVRTLIKWGADVNAQDIHKMTPLHYATLMANQPIQEMLLKNSQPTNTKNSDGDPYQGLAFDCNHTMMQLLLETEQTNDTEDDDGITCLDLACHLGDDEAVNLLLENLNYDHTSTAKSHTPLQLGVIYGYRNVVDILLRYQVPLDATGCHGCTALMIAAAQGDVDLACTLLNREANPNACATDGMTAVHMAAVRGHAAVVERLLARGADPNAICTLGDTAFTALHLAAEQGHAAVVERLLTRKANPNARNNDGWTALHLASRHRTR